MLIKRIDDLEKSFIKERKSHNSNNDIDFTKSSISTIESSSNNKNIEILYEIDELFNEETKKEFDQKLSKLNMNFEELEFNNQNNHIEINNIKNILEDINYMHYIFSQKFDKFKNIEKIILDISNKINLRGNEKDSSNNEISKNKDDLYDEFNIQKESFESKLEDFNEQINEKIENMNNFIKKIQTEHEKKLEEVYKLKFLLIF